MPNLCLALQQLKHISGSGHAIAKCAPCNKTTIYFQNGNIGLKLLRNPCSELSTVPALQQTVYIHHPSRGHLWKIGIYENVWSIAIREIESSQFFNLVSSEVRGHIAVLGDQLSTAEVRVVHLQVCESVYLIQIMDLFVLHILIVHLFHTAEGSGTVPS